MSLTPTVSFLVLNMSIINGSECICCCSVCCMDVLCSPFQDGCPFIHIAQWMHAHIGPNLCCLDAILMKWSIVTSSIMTIYINLIIERLFSCVSKTRVSEFIVLLLQQVLQMKRILCLSMFS